MKKVVIAFLILVASHLTMAQDYPIDLNKTAQYFKEIREICNLDNGNLWGENLWAPILLIDNESRFIVANQLDTDGLLKEAGNVCIGFFPEDKAVANSTTDYGNKHWMMVMYPLPSNDYSRNQLCIHELFHSLQKRMNLEFVNPDNGHLDNMNARILLKLEWSALEKAVQDETGKRKAYLEDALTFRNYRRSLYPGKDIMENTLEIQEGLAEYTGHKLCSESNKEFRNNVLKAHNNAWNNQTYVRSFAYYSGLLYGYLLDQGESAWRPGITPGSDLGSIIQDSYRIVLPSDLEKAFDKVKDSYNYEEIYLFEAEREKRRQEVLTAYRHKFTQDTILVLEIPKPNVAFDPRTLIPLDSLGTVYPTIRIIADWGILQVNGGGCLFDWKRAIVTGKNIKQENNRLVGEGWEIELADNWKLVRDGMHNTLKKEE
jgi:hypothetical protein